MVIIAHSQGAAVAHKLLRGECAPNVKGFVSVGSGIRKLHDLRSTRGAGQAQVSGWGNNSDELISRLVDFLERVAPGTQALRALAMTHPELAAVVSNRRFRIRPRAYSRFLVWTVPLAFLFGACAKVTESAPVAVLRRALIWALHLFDIELSPDTAWLSVVLGVALTFVLAYAWDWIFVHAAWAARNRHEVDRTLSSSKEPLLARDPRMWLWCLLQLLPSVVVVVLAGCVGISPLARYLVIGACVVIDCTFFVHLLSQHPHRRRSSPRSAG